ncbi:MAG: class I SAM-dependent methyltransferase [Anaerolineae bacterium]
MSSNKFDQQQYEKYWQEVHEKTGESLAAVCFPDKPLYFNLFFDRIQKWVVNKYLRSQQWTLRDQPLLDIGCGRGRWLAFFQQLYGARVTGIDLSPVAVESCRKQGFEAHVGSIEKMPFEDESFAVVTSITVLLHLPYDLKQRAVGEIARVVKKGGRVLLLEGTWRDPSPHVFSLLVSEWEALFAEVGLRMVHKSGHYFNIARRHLPAWIPYRDRVAIYLDYPIEFALNYYFYGRETKIGLQHFMVFEKSL